ncbi:uncharacterized protein PV07_00196 [Cladophialophora immunda]|uniref:Uncharacterized protein n=1 Tax=Cladophialophora immunda TaxID=569365 RepID=A0A0D2DC87_9EURO|nr:uncharacterized protein PV07_00196 [Cladophialophora immunda]KIW33339.1 hypothetical protein PV07_00196 [Cladophialophora immunda]
MGSARRPILYTSSFPSSRFPKKFACDRDNIIFMSFKLEAISQRKLIQERMRVDPRLDRILAYESVFQRILTTASELEYDNTAYCCCIVRRTEPEKG